MSRPKLKTTKSQPRRYIFIIEKMRNVLLTIKYDGTQYCGWQRQPGEPTVCGRLEEVLAVICKEPVKLEATSRTDAGVHAYGQRATLRGNFEIPADRIPIAANTMLADDRIEYVGDIEITEAKDMPEGFHARYNSKGKRYIYKLRNADSPDIFKRTRYYQTSRPLDVEAMRKAASYIVGTHDFACFQTAGGTPRETTVRTVYELELIQDGEYITVSIAGDGFLYNMVRIIVGTLVEVGQGRRTAESVAETIESKDRGKAGHTAPPQGLYLKEVFYDPEFFE